GPWREEDSVEEGPGHGLPGRWRREQPPADREPAPPMRPVDDTQRSRSRYWEAEQEAARRGSLAWGFAAFFAGYGAYYLLVLVISGLQKSEIAGFDPATSAGAAGPVLLLAFAPNVFLGLLPAVFSWWKGKGLRLDFGIAPKWRDLKDRKSTRLNSSHVKISYAVFCLKKKNKKSRIK